MGTVKTWRRGGADISECGRYRYRLWRDGWTLSGGTICLFVMLNPSTADGTTDDPTIRKCIGFTDRWGIGQLVVVNLFAFRSTSPEGLLTAADPVGPENDEVIARECAVADHIVLAWGSHQRIRTLVQRRVEGIATIIRENLAKTRTLGRCKDGSPRHPLMLSYDSRAEFVRGD